MTNQQRNRLLVILIILSLIPGLLLVDIQLLNGPIKGLLRLVGQITGVIGITLLMWEVFLGSRSLVKIITPDLMYVLGIHKVLGKWGSVLIMIHPILLIAYFGSSILRFDTRIAYSRSIWIGVIALVVVLLIWATSIFLKRKLGFRLWHLIHILTYIIVPLVLIHSVVITPDQVNKSFWIIYSILYFLILIYQTLFHFDIFRYEYQVLDVKTIADKTFTIDMKPIGAGKITPKPGQFLYLKYPLIPETHPFSISYFDSSSGTIQVMIKDLGPFTHLLQDIDPGQKVILDGAYGIFTSEAFDSSSPIVLLAGGVGVSPMMPLINMLEQGWDRKVVLFFGNRQQKDVPFADRLSKLSQSNTNFKLVNVLEKSEQKDIETGYITADLIKKYLDQNPLDYEYFVCGPPAMMNAMEKVFEQLGLSDRQTHFEKFV